MARINLDMSGAGRVGKLTKELLAAVQFLGVGSGSQKKLAEAIDGFWTLGDELFELDDESLSLLQLLIRKTPGNLVRAGYRNRSHRSELKSRVSKVATATELETRATSFFELMDLVDSHKLALGLQNDVSIKRSGLTSDARFLFDNRIAELDELSLERNIDLPLVDLELAIELLSARLLALGQSLSENQYRRLLELRNNHRLRIVRNAPDSLSSVELIRLASSVRRTSQYSFAVLGEQASIPQNEAQLEAAYELANLEVKLFMLLSKGGALISKGPALVAEIARVQATVRAKQLSCRAMSRTSVERQDRFASRVDRITDKSSELRKIAAQNLRGR